MIQDTGQEGELLVAKSERGHRPISGVRSSKNGQNFSPKKLYRLFPGIGIFFQPKRSLRFPPPPPPTPAPSYTKFTVNVFTRRVAVPIPGKGWWCFMWLFWDIDRAGLLIWIRQCHPLSAGEKLFQVDHFFNSLILTHIYSHTYTIHTQLYIYTYIFMHLYVYIYMYTQIYISVCVCV